MNKHLRRLSCHVGQHRIVTIKRVSPETEHVGCRDCHTQWASWMRGHASMAWELCRYLHTARGYDDRGAAGRSLSGLGPGRNDAAHASLDGRDCNRGKMACLGAVDGVIG